MKNGIIKIVSAHKLQESQREKLEIVVKNKHNEDIEFIYEIDENIIGGFRIEDGYQVYDSSILHRLSEVKKQMK